MIPTLGTVHVFFYEYLEDILGLIATDGEIISSEVGLKTQYSLCAGFEYFIIVRRRDLRYKVVWFKINLH